LTLGLSGEHCRLQICLATNPCHVQQIQF